MPTPGGFRLAATSALGLLSLVALWLLFELRYIWYLDTSTTLVLRGGFALAASAIVFCWILVPSRVLVAALGLLALFFPVVFGLSQAPMSVGLLPFLVANLGLLVGTTQLRRAAK